MPHLHPHVKYILSSGRKGDDGAERLIVVNRIKDTVCKLNQ